MSEALDLRAVSYSYGSGAPVLANASMALAPGNVCAVLGPNGAGKSTLARLAAGVFQPQSGAVLVSGQNLAQTAGPQRARLVRVSFQTPEHELFRPTLGHEIDWEAGLLGVDAVAMRSRANETFESCGASIPLDKHPYDLDPWQRKLFACVAALAIPGRLVILDEPTLRLGQSVRARLGDALRAYAREGGAVLFVTHDHEFAARICDAAVVVTRGAIARSGAVEDVLSEADGHAATTIYSFPSHYLDKALRQRARLRR